MSTSRRSLQRAVSSAHRTAIIRQLERIDHQLRAGRSSSRRSRSTKRITLSAYDAEHVYEWLRMYWRESDRPFGGCYDCERIGRRLERLIGPKSVRNVGQWVNDMKASHEADNAPPTLPPVSDNRRSVRGADVRRMQRSPIHPGAMLLEEFLRPRRQTAVAVARVAKIAPAELDEIVAGRRPVTAPIAVRLSAFTQVSPEFWLNLQMRYDLWQALNAGKHGKA